MNCKVSKNSRGIYHILLLKVNEKENEIYFKCFFFSEQLLFFP